MMRSDKEEAIRSPLSSLPATLRYKRVALAALRACMDPVFAPPGYNDICRSLWARLQSSRTLPSAKEFEIAWSGLYDLLRDAGIPTVLVGGEARETLLAARRQLDVLGEEARAVGLIGDQSESDEPY